MRIGKSLLVVAALVAAMVGGVAGMAAAQQEPASLTAYVSLCEADQSSCTAASEIAVYFTVNGTDNVVYTGGTGEASFEVSTGDEVVVSVDPGAIEGASVTTDAGYVIDSVTGEEGTFEFTFQKNAADSDPAPADQDQAPAAPESANVATTHPSSIQATTCAALDGNVAYALNDVAMVSPDAPADAVQVGVTRIDATIDTLLSGGYALNVAKSQDESQVSIVCGDIAGPVVNDTLRIALRDQTGSGYAGIALLAATADGGTDVTVLLAPPVAAVADATQPAAAETQAPATETEVATATEQATDPREPASLTAYVSLCEADQSSCTAASEIAVYFTVNGTDNVVYTGGTGEASFVMSTGDEVVVSVDPGAIEGASVITDAGYVVDSVTGEEGTFEFTFQKDAE